MKPTPQAIKENTRELGPLNLRAAFDPTTINKDERTVEVVASTENAVRIRNYVDWEGSEYVDEILSHNPKHVRMERINAGAPCLNNHYRYDGVNGVLGVVVKAWISGGQMRALIKFSKREDVEPVWQDVIDGILIGISVGYRVYEYEITRKEGAIDIYRAIDWEPFEISFAPVQADIKSGVRNADGTADKTVYQNRNRLIEIFKDQNPGQNIKSDFVIVVADVLAAFEIAKVKRKYRFKFQVITGATSDDKIEFRDLFFS